MPDIVVIDDRITNRNILTRLAMSLEEGIRVKSFSNPKTALTWLKVKEVTPDLIIVEVSKPDMSGAEFIRIFRTMPDALDVPMIVITSQDQKADCYQDVETEAIDYLLGPVDHLEFRARARNLLKMRKQQKLLEDRAHALRQELDQSHQHPSLPSTERRLRRLIDATPTLINSVNRQGKLTHVNDAHRQIYGVDPTGIIGRDLEELYGAEEATRHHVQNAKVFETGEVLDGFEHDLFHPETRERLNFFVTKSPLFDDAGQVVEVITAAQEITPLKKGESSARRNADLDPITDLPNRGVYRDYLENALKRALRREACCALLLVDLDRFKGVNDAFGLTFGDLLLKSVAKRLTQHLREIDVIGRLGGDEFVILQTDIKGQEDAQALAACLNESFSQPFIVNGEEVHISASIGITMFPTDGQRADRLLKNAELAMYRAKAIGRNAICFYSPKMNLVARRAGLLERELRQAVAANQFMVHYQPRRAIDGDRILGMEALLRWRHPRRGMVRPTEFIGLAENMGLINPITECVLEQSCRQHRSWIEAGLPPLRLAVNLSPIQFREEGVVDLVKSMLKRTGIAPETLEIELTEGVMLENSRVAIDSLIRLNDMGITFSLDDFGTGYSSLSYVRRLPVQRLKIDQSFVHRLGQDGQDDAIVRAIIDLGHSLDLKITAEGVETKEQLERLKLLGCDEVQGDLISPPLPADAFAMLFREPDSNAVAAG